MSEDSWDHARLIPTSGINGTDAQEHCATSALLAVLVGVPEFGRALIQPLGAPDGPIEAFIQVPLRLGDRKSFAGLIRVNDGQRTWTALVEARTGSTCLDVIQVEMFLDVAQEQGFAAVLTISNEATGASRELRSVGLHHYSWGHVLAEAVRLREQFGEEQDQGWVLGELMRYLEHPRSGAISGAMESEDVGSSQIVRGVEITSQEVVVAAMPEQREPVLDIDLREPQTTVLRTVLIPEPAIRMPPTLPSRREVRLVRQLGATTGEQTSARNDAGWYQDPEDDGLLRWWDGVSWSEWTYPVQPALA